MVARAATVGATTGAAGMLAVLLSPGTAAAEGGDGRYGPGEYQAARSHGAAVDRGYPVPLTRPETLARVQRQATFTEQCLHFRTTITTPVCPEERDGDRREHATAQPGGLQAPAADGAEQTPRNADATPDRSAPRDATAGQNQPAGSHNGAIGVGPDDRAPGGGHRSAEQASPGSHIGGVGVGPGDRAPAGTASTASSQAGAPAQRDTDGDGYSDGSMHESPEVGRRDGMHPSGTAPGPDDRDNDATHDASDMVDGRDDDGDGARNDVDARPGPDFDTNRDGVMDGWEKAPDNGGHQLAEPEDGQFYGGSARIGPVEVTGGMHPSGQKHVSIGLAAGTKAPEIGGYTPDPNGLNAKVGASYATPAAVGGGGISVNLSPNGQLSGTGFAEGGVNVGGWALSAGTSVTCGGGGCDWDVYTNDLRSLEFGKPGKPKLDIGASVNISGVFNPPAVGLPPDPVTTQKQGRVGVVETPGVRDAMQETQGTQEPSPERFGDDLGSIGVVDTPGVRDATREAAGLDGDDATGASSGRGSMSDENADRDSSASVGLDGNDATGASSGRGSMSDENADHDSSPSDSSSSPSGDLDGNDTTGASSGRGSMSDENADRH